jgi:hypothetical protein
MYSNFEENKEGKQSKKTWNIEWWQMWDCGIMVFSE